MTVYLGLNMEIRWLDGSGRPPLNVFTLIPAQFLATNMTQFPPANQACSLQAPVPFGAPGTDPAQAPVTLQGFPVTVSQML